MQQNRRKFIKTSSAATTALLLSSLELLAKDQMNMNTAFELKIMATNWGFDGSLDAYCAKAKKEGYDGIEIWWPLEKPAQDELFAALHAHGLEVGFLCAGHQSDWQEHFDEFTRMIDAAATNSIHRPLYINCHSGRDYFSYEQNKAFLDHTKQLAVKTSLTICHETHRSRMLFAAPVARTYIEKNPELRVTFDVSHWCNVSESLLQDQQATVDLTLQRVDHIHARIGHPDALRRAGVDVRVESPNVGERVIEQRGVSIRVRVKGNLGPTQHFNTLPKQAWQGVKYLVTRSGPIATGGHDLVCQFKSSPDLDRPDIQGLFAPIALDASGTTSLKLAEHSGVNFLGYQIRPTTTSLVHLSGRLPGNPPVIDARFLDDDADRQATAPALGIARRLFGKGPLADLVLDEDFPGLAVSSPGEVVRYALDTGAGIYHAVGASAMGPDASDVVAPQLRVRGVTGLRGVDASVLPVQVAGNTQAPAMAVAWITADLIREDS